MVELKNISILCLILVLLFQTDIAFAEELRLCKNPKAKQAVLNSRAEYSEEKLESYFESYRYKLKHLDFKNKKNVAELRLLHLARPIEVSKILVEKSKRQLHLLANDGVIRSYFISLGFSPLGHKIKEGDGKTPEGLYAIDFKNIHSAYYLALRISYPNEKDEARAEALDVSPGGFIMIHGFPEDKEERVEAIKSHGKKDWTQGCMGLTDLEIEEIFSLVDEGAEIEICP